MLNTAKSGDHVYLASEPADMRKSIDALAAMVTYQFKLDPFSNCIFVFCNRQKDKIKILRWEGNGFALWYKRLEKGKIDWPVAGNETQTINERQLRKLLISLRLEEPDEYHRISARLVS